jgi:hypothetical protein
MLDICLLLWRLLWASPNSLLGLLLGGCGLVCGGRSRMARGCLEFHGGLIRWGLERTPIFSRWRFTLGHTILGRDALCLEMSRETLNMFTFASMASGDHFFSPHISAPGFISGSQGGTRTGTIPLSRRLMQKPHSWTEPSLSPRKRELHKFSPHLIAAARTKG